MDLVNCTLVIGSHLKKVFLIGIDLVYCTSVMGSHLKKLFLIGIDLVTVPR